MKSKIQNPKSKILSVLLVEDNPGDARLIREMLAEGRDPLHTGRQAFDLEWADRLSTGLERLAVGGIDVALLDLSLPDSQGLETFLKIHDQAPGVPVVVITGLDDETLAVQAVHEGAQDYLVKGQVTGNLLTRAIRYAIERKNIEAMKDQFVSSLSHDLRTPLTAIKGYLDLLLDGAYGNLSAEQIEVISTLSTVNREMTTLVNSLLDLAKLRSGRFVLLIEPLDLKDIVNEVLAEVRPLAEAKGLALSKEFDQDSFPMKSDIRSLRQILSNLVSNAIKFTDSGDVKVSLNFPSRKTGSSAGIVRIRVEDTGCGIRADHLERIFDEFYQIEDGGDNTSPGTGLGLAICKRLAGLLRGEITVESQPGRGSIFSVTLPQELSDGPVDMDS
jgi:signal transduction histidine kinase